MLRYESSLYNIGHPTPRGERVTDKQTEILERARALLAEMNVGHQVPTMRIRSGIAQVVFRNSDVAERVHHLRSEFCVRVTGVVEQRPEGSENPNLASGDVELNVTELDNNILLEFLILFHCLIFFYRGFKDRIKSRF